MSLDRGKDMSEANDALRPIMQRSSTNSLNKDAL